jgi:DNA-binding Lrp family transcriptional regulator
MSNIPSPQPPQRHPETEQQPFNWRAQLPVHPAADAYPQIPRGELIALGNDIRTRGLRFKIVVNRKKSPCKGYYDKFELLDGLEFKRGNRRSDPFLHFLNSELCGFDGSRNESEVVQIPEEEIEAFVASANLHRRHLTNEDKDRLIARLVKANPEKSNRQIAEQVRSSHPHIAKVRAELEKAGDVETVSTSIDTKGRKQPAKRKGKTGKKPNSIAKSDSIIASPAPIETVVDAVPEAVPALAAKLPSEAGGTLDSIIEREWLEAERALEAFTRHTLVQMAKAIPPEAAARVREFANIFTELAKLTARSGGNGEAPVAISDSIPDDNLSIPAFLRR